MKKKKESRKFVPAIGWLEQRDVPGSMLGHFSNVLQDPNPIPPPMRTPPPISVGG